MKKKPLIIGLAAAALILGIVALLLSNKDNSGTIANYGNKKLFPGAESGNVRRITLSDGLIIDCTDGVKVSSPEDRLMDESLLKKIIACVETAKLKEVIQSSEDKGSYGIDDSQIVKAEYLNGNSETIYIGNRCSDGWYVLSAEGIVGKIEDYQGECLTLSSDNLISKLVFGKIHKEDIHSIKILKNEKLFLAAKYVTDNWEIEKPVIVGGAPTVFGPFVEEMERLEYLNLLNEDVEDIQPMIEISFSIDEKQYSLSILKKDKDSLTAISDTIDKPFVMDVRALSYLDTPLYEFTNTFVLTKNINKVSGIDFRLNNSKETYVISKSQEGSSADCFIVNGNDVSNIEDGNGKNLFKKHYQALISIEIADIVFKEPESLPEKADICIVYHMSDGSDDKIEFYPKGETYYIYRNGTYTGLVVNKEQLLEEDGVIETYLELMMKIE